MKTVRFTTVMLALACAPIGLGVAQSPAGTIQGRLTQAGASTGAVAGVRVHLDGTAFQGTTDSVGRFRFTEVAPGSHTIEVAVTTHPALRRSVMVRAGEVTEVSIDLSETLLTLEPLVVTASRTLHVIGHLPGERDNVIYAGKKTEVITLDSVHANLAQDVERQILGRIPGAHFSETAGAGFPSNGVGFRGLNPTQSIEMR